MQYLVIIESADDGSFSAFVPDLPGCVSCGDTEAEVRTLIREAIALHVDLMRRHGERVPPPTSKAITVDAA